MTLLVRDEADILDAQIAFHLHLGVDFVVATDNRSTDETTAILERYERAGVLHLLREDGEDLRQSEWVTRMARLAATELGADWILNTDADEFWWPRAGSFRDVLRAVPPRFGVVRGAWRNFVPRPETEAFFAERMTARLRTPTFSHDPLTTVSKSVHRAAADVRVGRGNHEAFGSGLVPLRGWYPIEILHFPVRSREQCRRKYVTQFLALARNPDKGTPEQIAEAYAAFRAGRFDAFYDPLVVGDDELEARVERGELEVDTRLRDVLRGLLEGAPARGRFPIPRDQGSVEPARPAPADGVGFAAEVSVIPDSDVALDLEGRVTALERRLVRLERSGLRAPSLAGVGRRLGLAR